MVGLEPFGTDSYREGMGKRALGDEIRSVQVGQKAAITSPVLGEESLSGQVAKDLSPGL